MSASSSRSAIRLTAPPSREGAGGAVRPREGEVFMSWFSRLPEAPGDVVLRDLLPRVGEDLLGAVVLDQASEHEEGGVLGDPGGLLHVVRHDRDRIVALQVVDELLDLLGGDRV